MQSKFKILILLFASVIIVSCSGDEQEKQEDATKAVNVETRIIEPQTFEQYLNLVGTVESENDVQISAEVSGRIEQYYVDKGDVIAKGAPILKIDDSRLQREQDRLQAQVEQAQERYERLKQLFEQDSIGAEMDVINARTTYKERQSALETVEVDLRNTTVRAPFTATLDEKLLETGEMASPGATLFRLIGTKNLKVVAGIPSRFSDAVSEGDRAQVWFDFNTADTLRLPISYVGQSINQDARTFKVEIDLPRETRNFKIDMNANVKVRIFKRDSSVVVGEEYIYQKEKGNVVYTVARSDSGTSVASERWIQIGPSYKNRVMIESGLNVGEELITVGSSFLQDSMHINIVEKQKNEIAQKN